jgi:iron complex transport system substrate-binding protein
MTTNKFYKRCKGINFGTLFARAVIEIFLMKIFGNLYVLAAAFAVICSSCTGSRTRPETAPDSLVSDSAAVEYAQGFSISRYGDCTLLKVFNPWQGAQNIVYEYLLCPKGTEIPSGLSGHTVIFTPIERVICLSTTHVAMLSKLGKTSGIKGLSGSLYLSDSTVKKAVAENKIKDIGYDMALNYEQIISLKPDVIFAYGIGKEIAGSLSKLTDLGQTVVFNAEYLERTALGKAEWLKFMAAFYGCEEQAGQQFEVIKNEYLSLCSLAESALHRPKVLCGLPWQGTWYIPGGQSFMSALIADAGGDYLWKDNPSHESVPINMEAIFNRASSADFWINTGAAGRFRDIKATDERLIRIEPYRTGEVYNNNARMESGGGNDFFESGVVHPHIILKDMIRIFHPELLPDYQMFYYTKLTD